MYKFTATEGATYSITSASFFDPYLLRIYDKSGNTIVANDEADDLTPTLVGTAYFYSDTIFFWQAPYSGTFYVDASWNQGNFYTAYYLGIFEDLGTTAPPPGLKLFAADGFEGAVSGSGLVYGGNGAQHLTLGPGRITLDPSFNRGGDTVELLHAPSDYQARRLGSSVILEGDEGSLIIPVGTAGITLDFDGDERTLLFDATAGSVKIGSEIIDAAGITLG